MSQHISPKEGSKIYQSGNAIIVDVRTPAEFSEVRAKSAVNLPLDRLSKDALEATARGKQILFICRSGKRSEQALAQAASWGIPSDNIIGGTIAWEQDGLPVERGERKVMSLERQVRIAAGGLVALGSVLALLGVTWALFVPLFVGCGLVFSGVTDTCGMAMILGRMPWNQRGGSCSGTRLPTGV